jgi:DNA mismatch repair protein MutS
LSNQFFAQVDKPKAQYPDALVLYRVGDFYEAFGEDADALASVLGLAKTRRGDRSMAGFPHALLERHLSVLIKAGLRVAVAEPAFDKPSAKPQTVRWEVP